MSGLINNSGEGMIVTTTDVNPIIPGNTYVANNPSTRVVFTLPTSFFLNQTVKIMGAQTPGWRLQANAGQHMLVGSFVTADGGHFDSQFGTDCLTLKCVATSPDLLIAVNGVGLQFEKICSKPAGGRLYAASGNPIPITGVVNSPTIFYGPYITNILSLYYEGGFGINAWIDLEFAETSLALTNLHTDLPQDIYAYNNAGVLALEAVSWADQFDRAIDYAVVDGIKLKSTDLSRRLVGTIYNRNGGTVSDNPQNRELFNAENRVCLQIVVFGSGTVYSYNLPDFRPQNNDAADATATFMCGFIAEHMDININATALCTDGQAVVQVGISWDDGGTFSESSTTNTFISLDASTNGYGNPRAQIIDWPELRLNTFIWGESATVFGSGTPNVNWIGQISGLRSRMYGKVYA